MLGKSAIFVAVALAVLSLAGGIFLAVSLNYPEIINRAGALIVCVEAIIALTERGIHNRLSRIDRGLIDVNPFINEEAERAEGRLFVVATSLAVAGELLHGFGDLIFTFVEKTIPW